MKHSRIITPILDIIKIMSKIGVFSLKGNNNNKEDYKLYLTFLTVISILTVKR